MSKPQEFELRELSGETKSNGSGTQESVPKQEVDGTVAAWTYASAILLVLLNSGFLDQC